MRARISAAILGILGASAVAVASGSISADLAAAPGIVDARTVVPDLQVDLRYATADNFLGRDVYGDLRTCYLVREAATMLSIADGILRSTHPDLRLHAWDCLRPRRVQIQMWKVVVGTPRQGYVADPNSRTGSLHSYGCAIDLTLARETGELLDMGTPFDFFGEAASVTKEPALLIQGKLTHAQLANRLLLREAMVRAGFFPLGHEWWHFNCARGDEARARYTVVE